MADRCPGHPRSIAWYSTGSVYPTPSLVRRVKASSQRDIARRRVEKAVEKFYALKPSRAVPFRKRAEVGTSTKTERTSAAFNANLETDSGEGFAKNPSKQRNEGRSNATRGSRQGHGTDGR